MRTGIDVSEHQGNINWSLSAKEADFAIIRAGYGRVISQKDKQFENNYKGCKDNNVPCGVYWYSYATTEDTARLEAQVCLQAIKGKKFEYPIYFDVEENSQFALGRDKVSKIIQAFCDEIEKAGYWAGLYMSASPLKSYVTPEVQKRYAVWVAHYGVNKPSYDGDYGMWQYSSTGRISGINGNVDMNNAYIDYPELIKAAGLNGFTKSEPVPEPVPEKKTIKTSVTIDGKTYTGTLTEE